VSDLGRKKGYALRFKLLWLKFETIEEDYHWLQMSSLFPTKKLVFIFVAVFKEPTFSLPNKSLFSHIL